MWRSHYYWKGVFKPFPFLTSSAGQNDPLHNPCVIQDIKLSINFFKSVYSFLFSVCVFACMYVCVLHVCSAHIGQKRASEPLLLELQMVVSHCMGDRRWTLLHCRSNHALNRWDTSLAPFLAFLKKNAPRICSFLSINNLLGISCYRVPLNTIWMLIILKALNWRPYFQKPTHHLYLETLTFSMHETEHLLIPAKACLTLKIQISIMTTPRTKTGITPVISSSAILTGCLQHTHRTWLLSATTAAASTRVPPSLFHLGYLLHSLLIPSIHSLSYPNWLS